MAELSKNFIEKNYSEGLKYKFYKDGTCKVIGIGSCQDQDIFIPSYITHKKLFFKKKYKVTHIGEKAFYNNKNIKSINIEDGIIELEESCFERCSKLISVILPDTITSIGDSAFSECSSLTSIVIPESVTSIGMFAFSGCSSLTSIVIPESVTSIGDSAFVGCSSLTIYCEASPEPIGWGSYWNYSNRPEYWKISKYDIITTNGLQFIIQDNEAIVTRYVGNDANVKIPYTMGKDGVIYNVTSIGWCAFSGCSSLTSIVIPESVTSIGSSAFRCCSSLTSITLPSTLTSIGDYAFFGCRSLTSIVIPESVTSIGWCAFGGFSSLESITLPFIGPYAGGSGETHFGYIFGASSYGENNKYVPSSLRKVIITNCERIESYAFSECSSLTSIVIPESVTSIGWCAFDGCSSLTSITLPSTLTSIGSSAFDGCSSLTSIVIPDTVISIEEYAFSGCSSLESIVIPDTVTSIGDSAFFGCSSLTIYCEASSKPSGWDSSWNYDDRPVYWDYKNKK